MSSNKSKGQYFTISSDLQQWVFDHAHNSELLLEPSFGKGHLLSLFLDQNPHRRMMCYEIDPSLEPIVTFHEEQVVVYGDFLKQTIPQRFATIVGNPPYVREKGTNLYVEFIRTCIKLLSDGGELIFIVPSDFLHLTGAHELLSQMVAEGSFTDFYFPHNERLFEGASVDVVVFRYERGVPCSNTLVNGHPQILHCEDGILTFHDTEQEGETLSQWTRIMVGPVSGCEEVFKTRLGNIQVRTEADKTETYLFTETFPTGNEEVDSYLEQHKARLMGRGIRSFNETNWFEWGALRNWTTIQANLGRPCIYVKSQTRHSNVAWIGTMEVFGASLLCILPNKERDLNAVVGYLNSPEFQANYRYAGKFKIGQKQLASVRIPQ